MDRRLITRRGAASRWLEALPLGNGRLGAMAWGDPDAARFSLNESTLWSGTPGVNADRTTDAETAQAALRRSRELFVQGDADGAERELAALGATWSQAYQPVGELVITRAGGPGRDSESAHQEGQGRTIETAPALTRELDLDAFVHRVIEGSPTAQEGFKPDAATATRRVPAPAPNIHVSFISTTDEVLVHAFPLDPSQDLEVSFDSPLHEVSRESAAANLSDSAGTAATHDTHGTSGMDGLDVVLRAPSDAPPRHAPGSPPVLWGENAAHAAVAIRWRRSGARCLLVCAISTSWRGLGAQPDRPTPDVLAEAIDTAEAALTRGESALLTRHAEHRAAQPSGMRLELGTAPTATASDAPNGELAGDTPAAADRTAQEQLLTTVVTYGQYLLNSASRPGLPPANLQGIWNREVRAPWSSNFTTNINLEMNHWPVGPAHVPLAAGALEEFVGLLRERGRETARRVYGADGWTVHHNTDAWGYTDPVDGDARWAIWPMGGLWLEWQLDDIATYTGEEPEALARRRFPHRREAARFALSLLREDRDGRLVTFPSTSPENRWLTTADEPVAISEGTGMDRWLVRETLRGLVAAAELVGELTDPVVERARELLPRLPDPQIGPDGRILEWHAQLPEEEPEHRHVSHLAFAFPGADLLDTATETAVAASLDARGDEATGWSLAWKTCLWARLRQPARVQRLLEMFLRDAETPDGERAGLYPNLFSAHPPFQMDANFGIVAAVAECLVQSHRGEVELLPTLPELLTSGQVTGLRARPGLVVDMTWKGGRPLAVRLQAAGPGGAGSHRLRWRESTITVQIPATGTVEVEVTALTS